MQLRGSAARVAALLLALGVALPNQAQDVDGHYRGFGDPGAFLNILPPGQDGVLNGPEALAAQFGMLPPHFADQLPMYGDLVYATPGLAEADLARFFKDASFGVRPDDIDRVYSPTPGVVVIRDRSFGVPHIFGETRYATMFAQGYTTAEDRLFLMDVLRHVGRARLSEFLGASPSNQALDRDQLAVAPYREEDLTQQLEAALSAGGEEAQRIHADLLAYVDGVNRYMQEALADPQKLPAEYPALQQVPLPWKKEDAVAIASLVGGIFGRGGGGELRNFCGLQRMTATLGDAADARRIFDDLHFADDPEAPTASSRPTPYLKDLGPVNPAAHPAIDCASLRPIDDGETSLDLVLAAASGELPPRTIDGPFGPIVLPGGGAMSNAILIGPEHTRSGHPIAVFGPQTAYFVPQLLVEKDVHGPGIDARGAAFAGTDLYVQLGRGRDYAWSATSASADNVDQFVLRLCDPAGGAPTPDSLGYLHDGRCEPIERYQHNQVAKPGAAGVPGGPDVVLSWRVERSAHYGPLAARGTLVDGTPIAIASLRTTYRNELGSARGFYRVNDPGVVSDGFESFRQAMGTGVDYTFNWFYVDARDIGYQHSCRCPQRAPGVDPYLPAWGTGEWDWRGFIPLEAQPFDRNPASGYLVSWNNKQAPGWTANDRQYSYGPVYRSELLELRVQAAFAAGLLERTDVVDAMEDAGTVDLRGQEALPVLLRVLGPSAPAGSDPRAQEMRNRLAAWAAAAAHRRDHDRDGEYDDPQSPAIMDAWWPRLSHAIFDASSAFALDALAIPLDDGNRAAHLGSAFQDGTHGHVQKDLRQLLGEPVAGAWSRSYCGGGNLVACRAALWQSLAQAAADLEAEFDSPNVADWKRDLSYEEVRHSAVGVVGVPAIHWINRPTFQQVVEVGDPPAVGLAFGAGSLATASGAKIGFAFRVEALAGGEGSGRFQLHDHAGGQKLDVDLVTDAATPAGSGCGSLPAGAGQSFEFSGTGSWNGSAGHRVRVCAYDAGDPGRGLDRLHVECLDCPYASSPPYTSELLATGNLNVEAAAASSATASGSGASSVIALEPVFGGSLLLGARAYDEAGVALAGVPLTLTGAGPPRSALTDSAGQALFTLPATSTGTVQAGAPGIESNPVRLTP